MTGTTTLALAHGVTHDLAEADQVLGAGAPVAAGEFAAWLEQQRQRRHGRVRQSLAELCEMAETAGDWPDALSHAHELVALSPLSEEAHRRVIRLHYLSGDRAAALLAFDRCERMLKDEVGARPSAETLALLRAIEQASAVQVIGGPVRRSPPVTLSRPPRLVGRDTELAALAQVLECAGRLALVGEAGIGKSRLLAEAALGHATAGQRPLVVVQARPGDAAVPYATLARCLRAVVKQAPRALDAAPKGELSRLLPELGHSPAHSPDLDGLRLLGAVHAVLDSAADTIDGVLLDDVHFIDESSAQLLRVWLGERADSTAPLALVLATRPQSQGEAGQLLATFEDDGRARRMTLAPLDEGALVRLVASLEIPGLAAEALAPQLLRHAGGNPMFVLETLKHAWDAGHLQDAAGAALVLARPASVGQLIERRLQRLSPRRCRSHGWPQWPGRTSVSSLPRRCCTRRPCAWQMHGTSSRPRRSCAATALRTTWCSRRCCAACPRPSAAIRTARWRSGSNSMAPSPSALPTIGRLRVMWRRSVPHLLTAGRRSFDLAFFANACRQLERAVMAARDSRTGPGRVRGLGHAALHLHLRRPWRCA